MRGVAVLSGGFSQRRFGDAGTPIGKAILVNGVSFTVVGVTPPEFFGVDPASAPQGAPGPGLWRIGG